MAWRSIHTGWIGRTAFKPNISQPISINANTIFLKGFKKKKAGIAARQPRLYTPKDLQVEFIVLSSPLDPVYKIQP